MGRLQAPIESCLGHNNTILIEEVLVIFIPPVPVYDTGFKTSAEGLENTCTFSLIFGWTPSLEDSSRTHGQVQADVHTLESLFGKSLGALTNKHIEVVARYMVRQFIFSEYLKLLKTLNAHYLACKTHKQTSTKTSQCTTEPQMSPNFTFPLSHQ